ncbi:MAG: hypothetical protein SVX43_17350 [Cyanobacteriota bacterium]|nr:hypothetical protein [Cyanobacteriota bacterium]
MRSYYNLTASVEDWEEGLALVPSRLSLNLRIWVTVELIFGRQRSGAI